MRNSNVTTIGTVTKGESLNIDCLSSTVYTICLENKMFTVLRTFFFSQHLVFRTNG